MRFLASPLPIFGSCVSLLLLHTRARTTAICVLRIEFKCKCPFTWMSSWTGALTACLPACLPVLLALTAQESSRKNMPNFGVNARANCAHFVVVAANKTKYRKTCTKNCLRCCLCCLAQLRYAEVATIFFFPFKFP